MWIDEKHEPYARDVSVLRPFERATESDLTSDSALYVSMIKMSERVQA